MGSSKERIQVRCIGCQAIGYVPTEGWADRPCPRCGCCLTDWVTVPGIVAKKSQPKAADWEKRGFDKFHEDYAELYGDGTEYSGAGKRPRLEDRDDFKGLIV